MSGYARSFSRCGYRPYRAIKRMHDTEKKILDEKLGKTHRFTVFRLGLDECAKCGKPRKEHG
jgi:hypothetical protein